MEKCYFTLLTKFKSSSPHIMCPVKSVADLIMVSFYGKEVNRIRDYGDLSVCETLCMRSFNNYSTHKRLGLRGLLDTTVE
jgi:hypothetical protein